MKYRIHTIVVSIFFLLVASGLLINHFSPDTQQNEAVKQSESLELHTIMRLLLSDIDKINKGIYTTDFDLIEQGAAGINDHPPLSDMSRAMVQETLGERMVVFGSFDNTVHSRADSMRNAALHLDMNRVLENYRIIQQGCLNCHTAFKQEIRNERFSRQHQNE